VVLDQYLLETGPDEAGPLSSHLGRLFWSGHLAIMEWTSGAEVRSAWCSAATPRKWGPEAASAGLHSELNGTVTACCCR